MTQAHLGPWIIPGLTQRLIELHATNISMRDVADKLSFDYEVEITRNAVIGRCRRLGLPSRPSGKPSLPQEKTYRIRKRVSIDAPIAPMAPISPVGQDDAPLTIYQLRDGDCHWPLGETFAKPPFMYCGQATEEGFAYCPDHHKRAHG